MGIQSPRLAATKTASANCVTKRIRAVGDWHTHTQMRPTINVGSKSTKPKKLNGANVGTPIISNRCEAARAAITMRTKLSALGTLEPITPRGTKR